ncbi:MAG: ribosome biogenesis GTPase Der, partial [Deltaproteobacteria bacterium]|nr:ribosome biogenesis GTPase Der [Deltaproteobacteria bacterium]
MGPQGKRPGSWVVALVGRPNVGKSTLFNRLTRSRDALVDHQPGVTRDRLQAEIHYQGVPLTLIDTGGFDDQQRDPLLEGVRRQVEYAVEEADRILFLVDAKEGLMPGDQDIADLLRRSRKPVFLLVNKVDGKEQEALGLEFYELGIGDVFPLSAAHGYGVRRMLEALVSGLGPIPRDERRGEEIRIAVLGRPNVGKSSLVNRLLGEERLLVSEIPGTTRDTVSIRLDDGTTSFLLMDTAGLRRRARVKEKLDKFAAIKSLGSLTRCDVAVLVMDGAAGITEQDVRICGYVFGEHKGLILAVNKWDLLQGGGREKVAVREEMGRRLRFVSYAPRLFISARTGEGVGRLLPEIREVYRDYTKRVGTGEVNRTVREILERHP